VSAIAASARVALVVAEASVAARKPSGRTTLPIASQMASVSSSRAIAYAAMVPAIEIATSTERASNAYAAEAAHASARKASASLERSASRAQRSAAAAHANANTLG